MHTDLSAWSPGRDRRLLRTSIPPVGRLRRVDHTAERCPVPAVQVGALSASIEHVRFSLDLDIVSVNKIASMLERAIENTTPAMPQAVEHAPPRFSRDPHGFTSTTPIVTVVVDAESEETRGERAVMSVPSPWQAKCHCQTKATSRSMITEALDIRDYPYVSKSADSQ